MSDRGEHTFLSLCAMRNDQMKNQKRRKHKGRYMRGKYSPMLLNSFPETNRHSAVSVLPRPVQFVLGGWWCCICLHSAVRHPTQTTKTGMRPLRSALLFLATPMLLWEPAITWGGSLWSLLKSLLPWAHSSVLHTHTDKLYPYALMPFSSTNTHMQADTQTSAQHTNTHTFKTHIHSQSCIHLFVYTLAHTPPLITLKCMHTCAATHKHKRHDRQ